MRPGLEHLVLKWLREEDPERLEALWTAADRVRAEFVGEAVHLRGLLEISNYCVRQCAYCGLRAGRVALDRYRMSEEEVLEGAKLAAHLGFGTVVLQSGEDYGISTAWMAEIIRRIKEDTSLAVTLSLGERPESDLRAWRAAGADRYLLRFETSDADLYHRIHPPIQTGVTVERTVLLRTLRALGYEIGSGVMVGIPGQSYGSLARDILLFQALDLDMIGIGPFIPHPGTPLGRQEAAGALSPREQVPNSETMVCKVLALARLLCPEANIPSTTALAVVNPDDGHRLGLSRGANVVMPNLTPPVYRKMYEIYPKKACIDDDLWALAGLRRKIESLGRSVGKGPGGRLRRGAAADIQVELPAHCG